MTSSALPQIIRNGAEFGEDVFHRNPFTATFGKPSLAFLKAAAILGGDRLAIGRSRSNGEGYRTDHHFQQIANGLELSRVKLVEQLVKE